MSSRFLCLALLLRGVWFTVRAICFTFCALCLALSPCAFGQSPLLDNFNPEANSDVLAVAVQPDGKILVGGAFTYLGGQPRSFIGRLNVDGSVDSEFNPGADDFVHSLAVQDDGKILVGGLFTTVGGQPQSYLGRLNPDGTADSGFNPAADGMVRSLEVQADGKILVGGAFVTLGGQLRQRIGRLHADGSLDGSFNAAANNSVFTLTALPDGKILVGGQFTNLNGQARWQIARLEADGTLDGSFAAEANGTVRALAVQADGRILLGGAFTTLDGQPRNHLGRLNADGTLDNDFNPGANGIVFSLALQADGKILAGGDFTHAGGQTRERIARFQSNGTLDEAFNPGAGWTVTTLALQPDGKIVVGGAFMTLGGQARNHIARLSNTEPATQSLTHDGSTVTWLRGGAGPEVSRTTFDYTTNGFTWLSLGAGERVSGGWQVSGASLPSSVTLRARGRVAGDDLGSRWFVENFGRNIALLTQPSSRTNVAGTLTTFTVSAIGGDPLLYQWWKDGLPLEDGGNIAGATTPTLTLSGVLKADEGSFSVVVSNAFGSVASRMATVEVIDPAITSEPVSQQRNVGESVAFSARASGTALEYQWFKGGTILTDDGRISGTETPALQIDNLINADEGGYSLVISNSFGSVTSQVAALDVIDPAIINQPASQTRNAGDSVTITVAAAGTALGYQWLKDGHLLSDGEKVTGAAMQSLTVSNLLMADAGGYSVVITNESGSASSVVATLTVIDPVIVSQITSQTRNAGERATLEMTAAGTAPLSYHWWKDGVPLASTSDPSATLNHLQYADDGNYSVVVSNAHGTATSAVARLTVNLVALDDGFNPEVSPGLSPSVAALVLQTDGKIVMGGGFHSLGGEAQDYIGRIGTDGSLDSGFAGANDLVRALAVQSDRQVLVGGRFTTLGGVVRNGLGRFNRDGATDSAFNPIVLGDVNALAVQADGKIILGGRFIAMDGQPRTNLARLNADGSLDASFSVEATLLSHGGQVASLALQPDGRILVGGTFDTVGGQPHTNIARLNADGILDGSFTASADGRSFNPPVDGRVNVMAVQADGKILIGGAFSTLNGEPGNYFGRINADGTRDSDFNPNVSGRVHALALQADGKILVGGEFSSLNGEPRLHLGRLNGDGTLDQGFNYEANGFVYAMALQADGKILIGGDFTAVDGQTRSNLARITQFEPATQRLSHDGSSVTWMRDGTSPEVWHTTFDYSVDGATWFSLGAGTRVPGGWIVPNVSLPLTASLRARGHVVGASAWVTESLVTTNSYVGAPFIVTQPASRTNIAGTSATFSVLVVGTQPLAFQWWKDDAPLMDGGSVVGATTATLTVENVIKADEGNYSVVVSNVDGNVTSMAAPLVVADPVITLQPLSQQRNAGASVTLSVTAVGTTPLSYQWWKDGAALPAAVGPSLVLTNLQIGNSGSYFVAVSNVHGSVTSTVATLTVVKLAITLQPTSRTQNAGESATFSVEATGVELSYQWFRGAMPLTNSAKISGVTTTTLTVSNLLNADEGDYSVVVSSTAGGVTSQVATLEVIDPVITRHPEGQNRNPGEDGTFSIAVAGTPPFNFQWWKNGEMVPQGTGPVLSLTNLHESDLGGYSVVVANSSGSATSQVAQLVFNYITLETAFEPGADVSITAAAVQPDGKSLIGGQFSIPDTFPRQNLARFHANGFLDSSFRTEDVYTVSSLAVQTDGKILVGGQSIRLHADGTRDTEFNSPNNFSTAMAVEADGRIVAFIQIPRPQTYPSLAVVRLNLDGSVDGTLAGGADGNFWLYVNSIVALNSGAIIMAGSDFICCGLSDYTIGPGQVRAPVDSMIAEADGKTYLSGILGAVNGMAVGNFVRLTAAGNVDSSFNPPGPASAKVVQVDGKVIVSSGFNWPDGGRRPYSRLNANGTLDVSLDLEDYTVHSLLPDGRILAGHWTTNSEGLGLYRLARLTNTEPATESLTYDGSTITWLRGGTSPEVWHASFDYSVNGQDWFHLGAGDLVPGGWRLTNAPAGISGTIRARGLVAMGALHSHWVVEAFAEGTAVGFITHPIDQTKDAGTTATFNAFATGEAPLSYRWQKDGMPLMDSGNIFGATTSSLVVNNLLKSDEGGYSVVISNTAGSVTSHVARLTVRDPVIHTQPLSQTRNRGESATFGVTAAGTPSLNYQWRANGAPVPNGTNSTLTLTNLQSSDAGEYIVVVSNEYGSVTSLVAHLTMNLAVLDSEFNPGSPPLHPFFSEVRALAVQPDGKILVSGHYIIPGDVESQSEVRLLRLNADGTLDSGFVPHTNLYSTLVLLTDGRIVAANGDRIFRHHADGTLDGDFNVTVNGAIFRLSVQSDGKILAGGLFASLGGPTRTNLVRFNPDGSVDAAFNPRINGSVGSMALQTDGKILVSGDFSVVGGQTRAWIARVNVDGTIDQSFNTTFLPGVNNNVIAMVVQRDGKILAGGAFTTPGAPSRANLARFHASGALDTGFNPGPTAHVGTLALQADGKILAGGSFQTLSGQPRAFVGRLNPDGTLDPSFSPTVSGLVRALAIQPDGKVLVGGIAGNIIGSSGQPARLINTEPATQSLSRSSSTITWLRGGASPEVWRATFEFSTDQQNWTSLGAAARIPGGWTLTNVAAPSGAHIRTRGYVTSGFGNASSWFVETSLQASTPVILAGEGRYGVLSNRFEFRVLALPGQTIVVDASTNLFDWTPLQTNTVGTAPLHFTDPDWLHWPRRFYRARAE